MNAEESNLEIWKYIKDKQDKFESAFTLLSFATLSLSVQFLSSFGKIAPYLLVISWVVFFVAAFCGAYRLMMSPQLDKIDRARVQINTFVVQRKIELQNPDFIAKVKINPPFDSATATRFGLDEMKATLKKEEDNLETAEKNLVLLDRKLLCLFYIQVGAYLLASAMTLVFVSINYLSK